MAPLILWFAGGALWFVTLGDRRGLGAIVAVAVLAGAAHYLLPGALGVPKLAVSDYKGVAYARKFPDNQRTYERACGYAPKGHTARELPFWVAIPYDRQSASVGNGSMVAFAADSHAAVDAFYAAAIAAGGTDEGAPGLRPHYHPDYYGAYVRDLDGNKLCAVCHHAG
jgi:catechol 2,3-dioxygenase-like lactoylglutathione lyase family enzyme